MSTPEIRCQAPPGPPRHDNPLHAIESSVVVVRHGPTTMGQIGEGAYGVTPVIPQCTQTALPPPPPPPPLSPERTAGGRKPPNWKDVVHDDTEEDRIMVIVPSMSARPSSSHTDSISPLPLLQRLASQRSLSNTTFAADSASYAGSGASPSQANSSHVFPFQLLRDRNSTSTMNSPDASQSASLGGAALFAASSVSAVSSAGDPSLFHVRPSVGSGGSSASRDRGGGGSSNGSSSLSDKSTLILSDSALERHRLEILGVRSLSSLPAAAVAAAVANSSQGSSAHHLQHNGAALEIPS